jgi:hypothetical protein
MIETLEVAVVSRDEKKRCKVESDFLLRDGN